MKLDQFLAGLEPKPALRPSLVAHDLADGCLSNADVFSNRSLRPLGVQEVADQRFPVHEPNISILMAQVKSKLIEFSNTLPSMDTLGSRVKEARLSAKLSQEGLARRVGVSQGLIGQIESGINQGSKHIAGLARVLGVSADWLETGKGPRERATGQRTVVADWLDQAPHDLSILAKSIILEIVKMDEVGLSVEGANALLAIIKPVLANATAPAKPQKPRYLDIHSPDQEGA